MKMSIIVMSAVLLFGGYSCTGQGNKFDYRALPKSYLTGDSPAFRQEAAALMSKAFDLTTVLPAGYVKDGSVDYTAYLQTGIDKHETILFPDFPVLVNEKGLQAHSNTNLLFKPNSKLILAPNNKERYEVLRITGVENVNVYFPVIVGDRDKHQGNTGEWGMGIDIRSSQNIKIVHPKISNCWGDGICIGQLKLKDVRSDVKTFPTQNIAIYNAELDYNRRNGISVGCVNGLKIIKPVISNSYGTAPMTGIDIEPNSNRDVVDNIEIDDPVTFNNAQHGISVHLSALPGKQPKEVNFSIKNHIDDGSQIGFYISGYKAKYDNLLQAQPLTGKIEVSNPVWKNNRYPFRNGKSNGYSPAVRFSGISVMKTDANGRSQQNSHYMMEMKKSLTQEKNISIQ
jgi:Right handed beta helix region